MMDSRFRLFALTGLILISFLLVSCEEDDPINCPTFQVGAIEGKILVVGEGTSAVIGARAMEPPRRGEVLAVTQSMEDGSFSLAVPSGLYRVELDPDGGIYSSNDYRDTVRVGSDIVAHDVLRGEARIRLVVPTALNGKIVNLRMEAGSYSQAVVKDTVTDGSLDFHFSLLPPESYTMMLQGNYNEGVSSFFLPGTPEENSALALAVDTDHPALYETDLTDTYSRIGGTVTGSWQQFGEDVAYLELINDSGYRIARTSGAEDGSFVFHSLVDQQVRLVVDIGWIRRWVGGEDFDTARIFDLQAGSDILDLEWVESGIQGTLSGPGNLLNYDFDLELWGDTGQLVYSHFYYSGNDFSLSNLDPGDYFLRVDGQKVNAVWAPQWYGGTESLEEAQMIHLAESSSVQLAFALVLGGQVKGRLGYGDGTFPDFFRAYLIQEDGTPTAHYPQQQNGMFSFRGLADGDYFLSVDLGTEGTWWYPGTWDQGEAEVLRVEDHSSHLDLTWNLPQMAKEVTP